MAHISFWTALYAFFMGRDAGMAAIQESLERQWAEERRDAEAKRVFHCHFCGGGLQRGAEECKWCGAGYRWFLEEK